MRLTARSIFLCGATLLAGGSLALLSGCKGNTTAAAMLEKVVTPPPAATALPASGNPGLADPLTDLPWVGTHFSQFGSPINTDQTTPATRGAILYDPSHVYVAFVSDTAGLPAKSDSVSMYLDSTAGGNGTEMIEVRVGHDGKVAASWIRSATPATKRDDGSPDFLHPLSTIPGVTIEGLTAKVRDETDHGRRVWTAVVGIPVKSLPMPLRASPQPGEHWKVNLLRTVSGSTGEGSGELLQSNLSPVYVNAQAVSPYRMADLYLSPGAMTASR
ncbi:MAG TPA: hypothetical protein VH253_11700 [Phycisphaerae bacterium]|nr:hypothetical protein [Phycisphaerae bacterium]